jgi:ribosomal protein S18 acetylase RimI-like enzyme
MLAGCLKLLWDTIANVSEVDREIAALLTSELPDDPLLGILGTKGVEFFLIPEYRKYGKVFCHRSADGGLQGVMLLGEFSKKKIFRSALSVQNFMPIAKYLLSVKHLNSALNAMLFLIKFSPPRDSLEIGWVAVRSDKQGMGVGSEMISDAMSYFLITQKSTIFVKTLISTPQNIKFYEKNGFTPYKEISGRVILTAARGGF